MLVKETTKNYESVDFWNSLKKVIEFLSKSTAKCKCFNWIEKYPLFVECVRTPKSVTAARHSDKSRLFCSLQSAYSCLDPRAYIIYKIDQVSKGDIVEFLPGLLSATPSFIGLGNFVTITYRRGNMRIIFDELQSIFEKCKLSDSIIMKSQAFAWHFHGFSQTNVLYLLQFIHEWIDWVRIFWKWCMFWCKFRTYSCPWYLLSPAQHMITFKTDT